MQPLEDNEIPLQACSSVPDEHLPEMNGQATPSVGLGHREKRHVALGHSKISYIPQEGPAERRCNASAQSMRFVYEKQFHLGRKGKIFSHRKSLVFRFARSLK